MNIEIANKLLKLRKENGLSQEELADKLGISRQAVSKWERAEASPDTDNLICLAKLYGVSLDELLLNEENSNKINNDTNIEDKADVVENNLGDDDENVPPSSSKWVKIHEFGNSIFVLLMVVLYIFLSAVYDLWHPAWLLFLLIPIFATTLNAIEHKKFADFAYPVLVTLIYLFISFNWNMWHPGWWMFLTIPLYYVIAGLLDNLIHKKNNN